MAKKEFMTARGNNEFPEIFETSRSHHSLKSSNDIYYILNESMMEKNQGLCKIFMGDRPNSKISSAAADSFVSEYVIVVKNPDLDGLVQQKITRTDAEQLYRKAFKKKRHNNPIKENLHYEEEIEAFMAIYDNLNDFMDGKAIFHGGRTHMDQGNVIDDGGIAKDFSTLIRNSILFKLVGHLGLKVKQVLSTRGDFIHLLITADEKDLEIEAERTRFSKQLEIALTDLISLMPCDEFYRPLHLIVPPTEDIKKAYKKVRKFYRAAFGTDKETEKHSRQYESNGVTPTQWKVYEHFLILIQKGVKNIKSTVTAHKNQMFLFQKLVKDSIQKANIGVSSNNKLKNLWDRLEISKAIPPYAEYKRSNNDDELKDLWRNHEINETGKRSLFKNMERIRLISSYIETAIDLHLLELNGYVMAHFPIHNKWQLKGKISNETETSNDEHAIMKSTLKSMQPLTIDQPLILSWKTSIINQKIPLSKIRNYYGEKIALYFEFLKTFQNSLLPAGILGIIVFIVQKSLSESNTAVLTLNIIYSVFVSAWATVLMEYWKRRESSLAILWGTTKFEQIEVPRGQFKGFYRRCPVTDNLDELHYHPSTRYKYFLLSVVFTCVIICMVLSVVAGLTVLKEVHTEKSIQYIASLINAIQIQIFNFIYKKLAKYLTDLENHKTQIQYEDSLIVKTFAFQFVNSFNSLAYIAFVKPFRVGCREMESEDTAKEVSCMNELFVQLLIIFLVSYVKNLMELGLPLIKYMIRKRNKVKSNAENSGSKGDFRTKVEKQVFKEYYLNRDVDGTIDDYLELAILFGYLTLFALAFPLSTFLGFLGLWLEMLTDKIKITRLVRRPIPFGAKDIGTWEGIFASVTIISIFSNTALFCFTAETFDKSNNYNFLVFGVVVVALLLFRSQLQTWIPDLSESFEIIQARHDYVVSRVLRGEIKEDIEEEVESYDWNLYFAEKNLK